MPFTRLPDSPQKNQRYLFTSSRNPSTGVVVNAAEKCVVTLDQQAGQRLQCIRIYSLYSKPGLEYPLIFNFPQTQGLQQPFPNPTTVSDTIPFNEGGIKVNLDATLTPVKDIYLHANVQTLNIYNAADPDNFYQGIIEFIQGGLYA